MTTALDQLKRCSTVVADTADVDQRAQYQPLLQKTAREPASRPATAIADHRRAAFAAEMLGIVAGRASTEADAACPSLPRARPPRAANRPRGTPPKASTGTGSPGANAPMPGPTTRGCAPSPRSGAATGSTAVGLRSWGRAFATPGTSWCWPAAIRLAMNRNATGGARTASDGTAAGVLTACTNPDARAEDLSQDSTTSSLQVVPQDDPCQSRAGLDATIGAIGIDTQFSLH
jgi:hypothetical protein